MKKNNEKSVLFKFISQCYLKKCKSNMNISDKMKVNIVNFLIKHPPNSNAYHLIQQQVNNRALQFIFKHFSI